MCIREKINEENEKRTDINIADRRLHIIVETQWQGCLVKNMFRLEKSDNNCWSK